MNKELKLNELNVINYDKIVGYAGRAHKPMVDWITESTLLSEKNLSLDDFNKIVSEHHQICGSLTYKKYKQMYSSGKILYKHVLKEVMY